MKQIISFLCLFTIVFSFLQVLTLPVIAYNYSGTCGENATWKLDKDTGLLTINGSGDMYSFKEDDMEDYVSDPPWDIEKVKSVKIKDGITSIGFGAFASCKYLTKVVMADSIKIIGQSAFENCIRLKSINVPKNVRKIEACAFLNCKRITRINLPDNLIYLEDYIFSDCKKLTSIKIGSKLKSQLSNYTFDGSGLKSISVSDKNKHYSSHKGILYNKNKTKLIIYPPKKEEHNFTIPNSVKEINEYAFLSAKNLDNLTIAKNVKKIDKNAFYNNYLESINVVDNNKNFCSVDNVLFNKSKTKIHLYLKFKKSVSYAVPNSVKTIGYGAFYASKNLEKVTLSNKLNKISQYAFSQCTKLKSIIIPKSVQIVEDFGFLFCDNLKKVVIPNHVSFGSDSFVGSDDLIIYCNKNSFAAKHAKDWNIKCKRVISKSVKGVKIEKRTSTSLKLKWKKIDGVKGYKIYDVDQKKTVKTVSTNTTSATISGLKSGSTSRYQIRAYKVIAGAKYYGNYSKTITAKTK